MPQQEPDPRLLSRLRLGEGGHPREEQKLGQGSRVLNRVHQCEPGLGGGHRGDGVSLGQGHLGLMVVSTR